MANVSIEKNLQEDQEKDLIENAENIEAQVGIFVLLDRMGSGFIREGTERMDEPDELDVANARQILRVSAYQEKDKKGGGYKRVPIEFRYPSEEIKSTVLDREGIPLNPETSRIIFKNGRLVVENSGATRGLYAFLKNDSRNASNPNRIENVAEVYTEIFPSLETEEDNDKDLALGRALAHVEGLIISRAKGNMRYDENRLKSLANLFGVIGEDNGQLIRGLIASAKHNPVLFLDNAERFEQKGVLEISQAETLGVIKFEESRVSFVKDGKPFATFSAQLSPDQKRATVAAFLNQPENNAIYKAFKVELDVAMEAQANK